MIVKIIKNYEDRFRLPTTDVLNDGCQKLIQTLADHFPKLNQRMIRERLEPMPLVAMR